jgi:hypothetical protein
MQRHLGRHARTVDAAARHRELTGEVPDAPGSGDDVVPFPAVRPVVGELLDVPASLRVDIEILLYKYAPSDPSEWCLELELRLATSGRVEAFLHECLIAVAEYQHVVDGLLDRQ